jgi:hypothetical protein
MAGRRGAKEGLRKVVAGLHSGVESLSAALAVYRMHLYNEGREERESLDEKTLTRPSGTLSQGAGLYPHLATPNDAGTVRSVIAASPAGPRQRDPTSSFALPSTGCPRSGLLLGSLGPNETAPRLALAGAARSLTLLHHHTSPGGGSTAIRAQFPVRGPYPSLGPDNALSPRARSETDSG